MEFTFWIDEAERQVTLNKRGDEYIVCVGDREYEVNHVSIDHGVMYFLIGQRPMRVFLSKSPRGLYLHYAGRSFSLETDDEDDAGHGAHHHGGDGNVEAPMPGSIVGVSVVVGDTVAAGDALVVIESMKMQNQISAPIAGEVEAVHCQVGDQVGFADTLVEIKAR